MSGKRITMTVCSLVALVCLAANPAIASNGKHNSSADTDLDQWWQNLPRNERQMLHDRHEIFQSLPAEQQEHLQRRWKRYQEMPAPERHKMHKKFQRWQKMDPEDRDRLRGTYRKFMICLRTSASN